MKKKKNCKITYIIKEFGLSAGFLVRAVTVSG